MTRARLAFFPGSPFARMARVLVREWALPVDPVEYTFPPTPDLFKVNPLGQVPALILPDRTIFPTFLILEHLWDMADQPTSAYIPDTDRQILLTILLAADSYVAACYQDWAGLGPVATNSIGYDPATRHLERVANTLEWLEHLAQTQALRDGITIPGVALSCLALWADARNGLNWRQHPHLTHIITQLADRESFHETRPQAWQPD